MRPFFILRPSPALVISFVALLVSLGGTSYAAFSVPANSVGTKQLRNGAVTTKKLRNRAVTAAKIDASGLVVPNALHANSANTAGSATEAEHATTANTASTATTAITATRANTATTANTATSAGSAAIATKIGMLSYRTATFQVATSTRATAHATCDPGTFAVGGGTKSPDETTFETDFLIDSHPTANRTGWEVTVENFGGAGALTETVYAVCVAAVSTG